MKQGISIERTYDLHDRPVVRILKRRGRLTLEEVSDLLRLEGGGEWNGWYAVLLNCTDGTIMRIFFTPFSSRYLNTIYAISVFPARVAS